MYLCCSKGLALPMGPCSPGYYCVGGATQARPKDGETGSICPPGTYCGKPVNNVLKPGAWCNAQYTDPWLNVSIILTPNIIL